MDTRLAPAQHADTVGGERFRGQETHLKSSVICGSGSCSCASSSPGEGRGKPCWVSLVALPGAVMSPLPPVLCLTSSGPKSIETPLPLPARSLKIQGFDKVTAPSIQLQIFFFLKPVLKETDVWAD